MKKVFIWIGLILLSPVLLFLILTFLLYLPPIQNWAVDKVAEMASDESGMMVTVDEVRLSFPLDLSINGVMVTQQNDTIADIHRMVADVKLLPLLGMEVVVNELQLNQAKINTLSLIPDVQVKGTVGLLAMHSKGIQLDEGTVELNGARLADANLTILLNDTAAIDTTTSEPLPWLINADSITILRSSIDLHMPGDSMQVTVGIGRASAKQGVIDLYHSLYTVKSFEWSDGAVAYHLPFEPMVNEGMDFNHLSFTDVNLAIDSIYFCAPNLALKIRQAALNEQSGLQLTQLAGTVLMDSVGLRLPSLLLATPYSNIHTRATVDFNVMDSIQPGQIQLNLNAQLGKEDLMLFMADMPEKFRNRWPEWPLTITADMHGNMEKAEINELELTLPTALHAKAWGQTEQLMDMDRLFAQLNVEAQSYDLSFTQPLADLPDDIRIPQGIGLNAILHANGPRYQANIVATQGKGRVKAEGWFNQRNMSYDASMMIAALDLHQFLPKQSLYQLSAKAKVKGKGTDFMKRTCWMEADASIDSLKYGNMKVDSIVATARLNNGHGLVAVEGHNQLLQGKLSVDALLDTKNISATIGADLQKLDFQALQVSENQLTIGMCGHIDVESNLAERHRLSGLVGDIYIQDSLNLYRPDDVGITIRTQADTTIFRLQSGDMIVKADASGGYELLIQQFGLLSDSLMAQVKNRTINLENIKHVLPNARLFVTSGRNNPIANMLSASVNTYFKELNIDLRTQQNIGINGDAYVYSLNADSIRIDTIRLRLRESQHGLTYQGQVTNNRRNPQFVFNALLDGSFKENGAVTGIRFYDEKGMLGLRLGAKATIEEHGMRVHLLPERPTLGYREFKLNADNFLFLGNDLKLQAKVDLIADDGTGVKIYSEDQDSTTLQDLTVSLYRFDLEKLTSAIPYLPRISGMLNGDYHLIMDQDEHISVASDMNIAHLTYESSPVGNVSTEFVYMQREDDTHALEAIMMLEEREVLTLKGSYKNQDEGSFDATLKLLHTPMDIVNGFVPDQLIGLEGYADGEMAVKGTMSKPQVDGEIILDSAFLVSKPYGMQLRFDNDPVRVINSQLLLENFTMYAYNDNPLNIMGNIDFHDMNHITTDLRIRARNFQLINAKQTKESIAYGKAYMNFFARMSGRLDQLQMRGRLDLLGTTDLTYLLLDSPLSGDNRMDELVKFTDFSDETQAKVEKPVPDGLNVDITISIDPGVHVRCGLDVDQTNYVDLFGGGDLSMKYNSDGINMTGRYTMSSGSMKYSLPVIPLKTFTIQDGSYVEFTGDPMNPRLNLTATERTKASVGQEGEQSRSVAFDCGVVITKTLNDMGLEFIISAPEDMTVANELTAMTPEQRGKLAVTMLTTGMYLADGNTSGFSMNSALSSFLQSEINSITGSALKTLDLSVGLDNTTDATGETRTDYSFKFAKRFWNNRLKVQIGGKISSGNEIEGEKQSFFDNVAMEYRLTPTSNQYAKLFYNQNVYDWLDGYTSEYGGGYMWKRKLNTFMEIFQIWGKQQTPMMPRTTGQSTLLPRTTLNRPKDEKLQIKTDSIKTDSIR